MIGVILLGRRAIAQGIISTMTTAKGIPAPFFARKRFTGTASAGGASSITLAANTVYGTDQEGFLDGCKVKVLSGTGVGQERTISAYVASTGVATVSVAWVTNPDNTSHYEITHYMDDIPVQSALLRVETAAVLVTLDGSTPTVAAGTNIGMELADNETWLIDDVNNLRNMKAINAVNANGAVLKFIVFA